jgi:aspartokinase
MNGPSVTQKLHVTRSAESLADQTRAIDGLGAVSVVGTGINATYANVRRGSAALRQRDVVPQGVATSSFRITWLVPRASVDDSVRAARSLPRAAAAGAVKDRVSPPWFRS